MYYIFIATICNFSYTYVRSTVQPKTDNGFVLLKGVKE